MSGAPTQPSPLKAMAFQQAADQALLTGRKDQFDQSLTSSAWFETAKFFAAFYRRAICHQTKGQRSFLRLIGVGEPAGEVTAPGVALEKLSVTARQAVCGAVSAFFEADRQRVLSAMIESEITKQGLVDKGQPIPGSIRDLVEHLPDAAKSQRKPPTPRKPGPRPRHEVDRMMGRLQRKLALLQR